MGVEPEIDDVAAPHGVDVCELRLGRLAGRGYPVIEPTPVVDGFRVSHHSLDFGFPVGARRGTRLIGADSFPRISNPRFPRASSAFEVALPDSRASFSRFVPSHALPHVRN
jgi:hypothetical protein